MSKHPQKIILAPEDPQVVVAFKLHREKFLALLEAGVFDMESGRAELNINNGQIQSVHLHQMTYRRAEKQPHVPA